MMKLLALICCKMSGAVQYQKQCGVLGVYEPPKGLSEADKLLVIMSFCLLWHLAFLRTMYLLLVCMEFSSFLVNIVFHI